MKSNHSHRCYIPLPRQPKPHAPPTNYSLVYPVLRQNLPFSPPYHLSPSQSRFNLKQQNPLKAVSSPPDSKKHICSAPAQNTDVYLLMKMNPYGKETRPRECNPLQNHHILMSPCRRELPKPKISFSYNKEKANQTLVQQAGSCKQMSKQQPELPCSILQFQLFKGKPSKKEKMKRLKIYSKVFSQVYQPNHRQILPSASEYQNVKESEVPIQYFERSINTISYLNDEDAGINKQSKMASTQITQSFTMESRRSDFQSTKNPLKVTQQSNPNKLRPPHNIFSLDNIQLSLQQRLSPQKILKKTIIENNYDFGGIFRENKTDRNITTLPKLGSNGGVFRDVSNLKWGNFVKGLFQEESEDDNLKKSIHCGPQIRHERFKCEMLDEYGEMTESIVPAYD